jgi:hypothetical protein
LSTGSGKAVLNYGGNPVEGFFEFVADQKRGKIASPFAFDNETTFTKNGRTYMRKSFSKGGSTPTIDISTGSGTAELKRR